MKSLLTLFLTVLDEVGDYCSIDTTRDAKSVTGRLNDEGENFFILSLPRLGAGLEKGLASGAADPTLFLGFKCREKTPVLFGAFFDLIFDRTSGAVLDEPSIEAIRSVRQLTLMFKKIEEPCSPKNEQLAFDQFVQCDIEVGEWEQNASIDSLISFHQMSQLLFSSVFLKADHDIRDFALVPKHGPGATAEKIVSNQKFEMLEWTHRLEAVFPYWLYATTSCYSSEVYDRVDFKEPDAERPVRVISVPKTPDKPRIISIEPTCMQYMQQGIARSLKRAVDSSYLEQLIGTTYQEPNQLLAERGSLDGSLATLDLSEASDRVSNLLVLTLFAGFPHLSDGVQACRSQTADVPGHGVLTLNRFASMGSALCFPVESMVFLTIVMLGLHEAYGLAPTRSSVRSFVGSVRIYGDDIIIPVDAVDHVMAALTRYGSKVNASKSFWTGRFRESCGKEYYAGSDVTICRVRRKLPTSREGVSEVVSAVEFRNNAYRRGLWKTARFLDDFLSELIPFPVVADTSEVLGRVSVLGLPKYKMCPKLHRPLVKGAMVRYRRRFSPIDDVAALMKSLGFNYDDEPYGPFNVIGTEKDHLQYAGRPEASSIILRNGYAD